MSDNYIVSARKYRPQTFDTVVGQEHITTTLKNAIRHQHLAHAYLFCGPRGVGKTTCARILAKTINCENPTPDMEACGVCANCQNFGNNTSFNIFELDAASNNSVDDIRNLIDQVRFAPQQGKYKVYIIDEVHMLSAAAFNAFLKTLEEPPPYAIFILATTEKHKILPTILSRCQIFDFKRITTNDIVTHLAGIAAKEGMQAQEAALHVIAQKSEGCMRDALSMLDRISSFTDGVLTYSNTMEHLNLLDADFYFKLVDCMLCQDVSGTLLLLDQVLEKGFEGDVIMNGLAEHMRNLLLCKDQRMAKLLDVPNDHKPMYFEKANQAPPSFVLSALNVINDSELNYKNATNRRLHVELCLIKLCYVLQAVQATAPPMADSDLKKKPEGIAAIPAPVKEAAQILPQAASAAISMTAEPVTTYQVNTPVKPAEPLPQPPIQEPKPVTPVQEPNPKPTIPTGNANPARRLNKSMMSDLDATITSNAGRVEDKKELKQESVQAAFEIYKAKVQAENKTMLYVQLCVMQLEVLPPDEVRIVSPTDITNTYANQERNLLIDFFRQHTGVPALRITTEHREDAVIAAQQQTTVLSRQEMYDAMAAKNPYLARLKEGLNLQIDY
ncbi:MAG: DNA polymerase III subunit gamma/tau [Taibaiella sp.]|nr:DNA polymerase III subunit gamma/tau [Taibaiella sp.]